MATAGRTSLSTLLSMTDDWRLLTLNPSDATCSSSFDPGGGFPLPYNGTGCTGGELSGLFVTDLGNKAGESVLNPSGDFWSGTAYAPDRPGAKSADRPSKPSLTTWRVVGTRLRSDRAKGANPAIPWTWETRGEPGLTLANCGLPVVSGLAAIGPATM